MILMATSFFVWVCLADQTCPNVPSPKYFKILYKPTRGFDEDEEEAEEAEEEEAEEEEAEEEEEEEEEEEAEEAEEEEEEGAQRVGFAETTSSFWFGW